MEAEVAVGGGLRAVEVAAVVLVGLLVCPPLAILVVVVVVPLLVTALVLGLLAAVLATPYLLVQHFRGHPGGHLALLKHRLRRAGRALARSRAAPDPRRRPQDSIRAGDRRRSATCARAATASTQPTTTVELFFDLVYVFAVTQLSHQILGDLSVAGVARAAFLLLVVWWAWIYTTWMANWFDPASPAVRGGAHRGDARAACSWPPRCPRRSASRALLFAASYVALQVGRNAAAARLLHRRHRLRDVFERLVVWSAASGVLWLAGAALDGDQRLVLWIPALALELAAPAAGYWLPGRGRAATTDYDIEGSALRRALPDVHHHRARRVDRGHRSDRVRGRADVDGRALPRSSRSSRPRRCGGCTSARRPSTRASR